jgi:Peptidase inhibitor family I36
MNGVRSLRKSQWQLVLAAATAASLIASPGVAMAAPSPAAAMATFDGQTIDLSKGWGRAKSCIVFAQRSVECFATSKEADARLGYVPERDPQVVAASAAALALPACSSGYLCLWEATNGNGRRLQFADGYWQDLLGYGFANVMSSWRNNSDAEGWGHVFDNGGKGELKISPRTYSSNIGTYWNDTADQVHG